jgi:DNA repair protein RadD
MLSPPVLRPDQVKLRDDVKAAWATGARNVVMRSDTGTGKTVILSDIVRAHDGYSRIFAHRDLIVGQLSLAIARNGVRHNVICSDKTRREIVRSHIDALGYSMIDVNARCAVGSVDTMARRDDPQAQSVTLVVPDEAHHVLRDNKWGRVIERYTSPQLRGLFPTATPCRSDGMGLGAQADGLADAMVQGPPMRWHIDAGNLSDYKVYCPTSDIKLLGDVAKSGDWSTKALKEASAASHITGDAVAAYRRFAAGKRFICFTTDVDAAVAQCEAFNQANVPSAVLTGETDAGLRRDIIRRIGTGELLGIIAVDVVAEGFDLPAVECVIMARPTASLVVYMQQWGRAMRRMAGKTHAVIIDLVGNLMRHGGPPDKPRVWTLDRTERKSKSAVDAMPIRVCVECYQPYEAFMTSCPHCGHKPTPRARGSIEAVDGDLAELDPALLAQLRAAVAAVDMPIDARRAELQATGLPAIPVMANVKRHSERQKAQAALRIAMAHWHPELSDRERQKAFWFTFGVSVIEAVALGTRDAELLLDRVVNNG